MKYEKMNGGDARRSLPLDVGVTLSHRSYNYADTIVKSRAARALSEAPRIS